MLPAEQTAVYTFRGSCAHPTQPSLTSSPERVLGDGPKGGSWRKKESPPFPLSLFSAHTSFKLVYIHWDFLPFPSLWKLTLLKKIFIEWPSPKIINSKANTYQLNAHALCHYIIISEMAPNTPIAEFFFPTTLLLQSLLNSIHF